MSKKKFNCDINIGDKLYHIDKDGNFDVEFDLKTEHDDIVKTTLIITLNANEKIKPGDIMCYVGNQTLDRCFDSGFDWKEEFGWFYVIKIVAKTSILDKI